MRYGHTYRAARRNAARHEMKVLARLREIARNHEPENVPENVSWREVAALYREQAR